jgi:hypothetical protein
MMRQLIYPLVVLSLGLLGAAGTPLEVLFWNVESGRARLFGLSDRSEPAQATPTHQFTHNFDTSFLP